MVLMKLTNCLNVFDHFVRLALTGLKVTLYLMMHGDVQTKILTFFRLMLSSYRNQSIDIRLKPLTGFCMEDISMKKVNVTYKQEKYLIWSKHWLTSNFFCVNIIQSTLQGWFWYFRFFCKDSNRCLKLFMLCQCIFYCDFSVCFLWSRLISSRHFSLSIIS